MTMDDPLDREEQDLADFDIGFQANMDGEPADPNCGPAWMVGWQAFADAAMDEAVGEGSLLRAESRDGVLQMTPVDAEFSRQVEVFLQTERDHRNSYRELAK